MSLGPKCPPWTLQRGLRKLHAPTASEAFAEDGGTDGNLPAMQHNIYDIKGILGYISISMVYEWYIMIKCDEYW